MKSRYQFIMALAGLSLLAAGCGDDGNENGAENGGSTEAIVENTSALCSDGLDNDGDGLADCKAPGCKDFAFCKEAEDGKENTLAACMDGIDNDGDGAKDCDDSECKAFAICQESEAENTLAKCQDGLDNDKDTLIDCEDPDCKVFSVCNKSSSGDGKDNPENTVAACTDGVDNDGDGKVDCEDPGCLIFSFCKDAGEGNTNKENTLAKCTDGLDNDDDGDIDCLDADCQGFEICKSAIGVKENTRELCTDGKDNDFNGKADCEDDNCALFCGNGGQFGENTYELCKDGIDNDGDGVKDCEDPECLVFDVCMGLKKPEDDKCPEDPFKYIEDKCPCGQTLIGDECYENIVTAADLDKLANSNKKYIIKQPIDLGTRTSKPIEMFQGVLDGGNQRISGVVNQELADEMAVIESDGTKTGRICGLFGAINDKTAVMRNVSLAITLNCIIPTAEQNPINRRVYVGGLAGFFAGTSEHITGSSKVYYKEYEKPVVGGRLNILVGGIFGKTRGKMSNMTLTGNVSADIHAYGNNEVYAYVGGIVGFGEQIVDCKADNNVTVYKEQKFNLFLGGLAGNATKIVNSSNRGNIKSYTDSTCSKTYVGGLAGSAPSVTASSFTGLIETDGKIGSDDCKNVITTGGIIGLGSDTGKLGATGKTVEVDGCSVDADFRIAAPFSVTGGIVGSAEAKSSYIRNNDARVNLYLHAATSMLDGASVSYGGIANGVNPNSTGKEGFTSYVINNSARTHHIEEFSSLAHVSSYHIGGISSNHYDTAVTRAVNNFVYDKVTCLAEKCAYTPVAVSGRFVYESYWNKDLYGLQSGALTYSDVSAESYTYNLDRVPVTRSLKTVLGLLRYNAGHNGGVLSANIPNDAKYADWTTIADEDGNVIPVPKH